MLGHHDMTRLVVACLFTGAVLLTTPSHAATSAMPPSVTPTNHIDIYQVDPWLDGALTGGLLAASAAIVLLNSGSTTLACHPCKSTDLNALDRWVVNRPFDNVRTLTDIMVAATIAAPIGLSVIEAAMSDDVGRWNTFLVDSLVFAEAMAVTVTLNQVVKYAVRRPRPYAYKYAPDDSTEVEADATASFYSGHTASAFTAAVALARTFTYRHPDSATRYLVWGGALTFAAGTGIGRVLGGNHFWTDVMVGAVMGAAVGWWVPGLHLRETGETTSQVDVHLLPNGVLVRF